MNNKLHLPLADQFLPDYPYYDHDQLKRTINARLTDEVVNANHAEVNELDRRLTGIAFLEVEITSEMWGNDMPLEDPVGSYLINFEFRHLIHIAYDIPTDNELPAELEALADKAEKILSGDTYSDGADCIANHIVDAFIDRAYPAPASVEPKENAVKSTREDIHTTVLHSKIVPDRADYYLMRINSRYYIINVGDCYELSYNCRIYNERVGTRIGAHTRGGSVS